VSEYEKADEEELWELVKAHMERHQEVLDEVYAKCPEEAKSAIAKAKEESQKGEEECEEALKKMGGH